MFAKETSLNIKIFDTGKKIPDVPTEVRIPELSVPPLSMTGPKSGSYLIAQYCQIMKFCLNDYVQQTAQDIETAFYTQLPKIDGYIKFSDGVNAAASYLNGDAIFFNTVPFIKRFIHKFGSCLVELLPDTAICSGQSSPLAGIFNCPALAGTMFDENLTKGFIACGYDQNGILLQNSLGQAFGHKGFMKMEWQKLQQLLVKAACVKNMR